MKAKTKFTKLWSILIALAMVVGMLPIAALAAEPATATADFSTDPTTALALLNAAKTGTADSTWDPDTNTLTLNGVNFVTTATTAVELPANSKIVLAAGTTNTITGGGSASIFCVGIIADSLTISGTGQLTVTGGNTTGDNSSDGIVAQNDLTITGGTVTANGGTANGASGYSVGINVPNRDVNISGGTVTATGGDARESSGFWAANNSLLISGGKVVAIGGDVSGTSSGIFAKNVVIKNTDNRTPDVTTGGGEARYSRGIYIVNDGSLTISGGSLIADSYIPLSESPAALPVAYSWRTSSVGVYTASTDTVYTWRSEDTYVEIRDNTAAYTVSFDANGGSGTMATDLGVFGVYTLPENGFTPPAGMQLKGWSVNGTEKAVGDTITVSADTTVKAVWEANEYNVTVTGGTASVGAGTPITKATMGTTVTMTANAAPSGKVFDKWVVESESASITLGDAKSPTTTFTMPAGNVSVKATYVPPIPSVAITGIDAPKSNTAFDTAAVCESAGVSNAKPTVTWDPSDSKAGYGKIYTASITLTASEGYVFADSTTVTVNGNPATSVTKNANGTLTVTYAFPATDKHNIEITVDTDVRDGDAAKNPTISSGYEIEYCLFVEDTDKDGVFINKTGNRITLDDKTMVVDKALVEAFAAQSGGRFTYESLMAVLKDEFDLDELKTEFTGGYDYSVFAYICHSDNAYFDYDDNQIVTNAIVKVNGKKITDNCLGYGGGMDILPGAYVFSAAKTYTVSFDANGGTGSMADATGVLGDYNLPENGFTAPDGKQFKAWSVDGTEKAVGDKITVTADTTVTAVWEAIEYNVTVTDGTASVGAGTPITKATMGTTVTLTANAAPSGKLFDKWVVESGNINLADENSAITTFKMPDGAVSVKATYKTITYGDLNGDGKINLLDLIALRKHLAKWSIEIDMNAADCNADGKINLMDLILLRKYLAKWNVTLGSQK